MAVGQLTLSAVVNRLFLGQLDLTVDIDDEVTVEASEDDDGRMTMDVIDHDVSVQRIAFSTPEAFRSYVDGLVRILEELNNESGTGQS